MLCLHSQGSFSESAFWCADAAKAERHDLTTARSEALEATAETLRQQIAEVETALTVKTAEAAAQKAAAVEAEGQVSAAESQAAEAEKEARNLGQQVAMLQVCLSLLTNQTVNLIGIYADIMTPIKRNSNCKSC